MACFLFLMPNSEQILHTLAMAPAKLRAIWFEAFVILPLWLRVVQVFKFLHILKLSATVAKCRWVGAIEGHGFGLVHIQRQPFQSRVGMESVELELEVVGSVGSKCNIICIFTMGNFGCLQGFHCPMIRRVQELVSSHL